MKEVAIFIKTKCTVFDITGARPCWPIRVVDSGPGLKYGPNHSRKFKALAYETFMQSGQDKIKNMF